MTVLDDLRGSSQVASGRFARHGDWGMHSPRHRDRHRNDRRLRDPHPAGVARAWARGLGRNPAPGSAAIRPRQALADLVRLLHERRSLGIVYSGDRLVGLVPLPDLRDLLPIRAARLDPDLLAKLARGSLGGVQAHPVARLSGPPATSPAAGAPLALAHDAGPERRLAAVLIADVVGYARHSRIDEEGTRARFQEDLREVFGPRIAAAGGRLVNTMGDGLLVEFHSVVDALRCAVEIQRAKGERNGAAPVGGGLEFRIGINLGDVIVEGDDIHGDAVNVAERLQHLAEPGGVVIAGTAYDQVQTKLALGYAALGTRRLEDVGAPVRVYRVLLDPAAAGTTVGEGAGAFPSWRWLTAAVLVLLPLLAADAAW